MIEEKLIKITVPLVSPNSAVNNYFLPFFDFQIFLWYKFYKFHLLSIGSSYFSMIFTLSFYFLSSLLAYAGFYSSCLPWYTVFPSVSFDLLSKSRASYVTLSFYLMVILAFCLRRCDIRPFYLLTNGKDSSSFCQSSVIAMVSSCYLSALM